MPEGSRWRNLFGPPRGPIAANQRGTAATGRSAANPSRGLSTRNAPKTVRHATARSRTTAAADSSWIDPPTQNGGAPALVMMATRPWFRRRAHVHAPLLRHGGCPRRRARRKEQGRPIGGPLRRDAAAASAGPVRAGYERPLVKRGPDPAARSTACHRRSYRSGIAPGLRRDRRRARARGHRTRTRASAALSGASGNS